MKEGFNALHKGVEQMNSINDVNFQEKDEEEYFIINDGTIPPRILPLKKGSFREVKPDDVLLTDGQHVSLATKLNAYRCECMDESPAVIDDLRLMADNLEEAACIATEINKNTYNQIIEEGNGWKRTF